MVTRPTRTLACILAGATLLAQAAIGESDSSETLSWTRDRDSLIRVDNSDPGNATNFYSYSRTIRSAGGSGPVLMLNCQAMSTGKHSLNAAIQLDPANTYEEDPSEHLRLLSVTVALTIDGQKKFEKFQYHPESSKIVPFNNAVSKRLYNAAVSGAPVTLKVKGKTYDLALPGRDKTFTAFAKACPTTNGGKFDPSVFDAMDAQ